VATRLVVGCMTGTSVDGIDAALVEIVGTGLAMTATPRRLLSRPLGPLGEGLRALAGQQPLSAGQIAGLGHEFERLHLGLLHELCAGQPVALIAVHGQTVFHAPPVSWQLMSVAKLARGLSVPIVFDLRAADLAAGGQGAPITPLADHVFFRAAHETRVVLNLGGFCNYTWLPRGGELQDPASLGQIRGGDICVCNQLLDALARKLFGVPFDAGGKHALAGQTHPEARAALLTTLRAQAAGGRSLGTGDEHVGAFADWAERVRADDLVRTACETVATAVAERVGGADRMIVAGGGALNQALVRALSTQTAAPVALSDEFGVPAQAREAAAMAVLGALCQDGVPITLPQITGCATPAPQAGCWVYPSAAGGRR
jgi:1,6-anhydro-N-acetylmuramate kinase